MWVFQEFFLCEGGGGKAIREIALTVIKFLCISIIHELVFCCRVLFFLIGLDLTDLVNLVAQITVPAFPLLLRQE